MPEFMAQNLAVKASEIPNWFAVTMGIGTVFVGLISIILICSIMGLFFKGKKTDEKSSSNVSSPVKAENRQEIIAAVCAAAAEELGTDISALRVVSFKKL